MSYDIIFAESNSATAIPELYFTNYDRELIPEVRDEYVTVPGRAGSWLFTEDDGDRMTEFDWRIVASSVEGRRTAEANLRRWARSTSLAKLIVSDQPDQFWWAKAAGTSNVSRKAHAASGSIMFRTSPYAEALSISEQTIDSGDSATGATILPSSDVELLPVVELTGVGSNPGGFALEIGGVTLDYADGVGDTETITVSGRTATVLAGAVADTEMESTTGYAFEGGTLDMAGVTGAFGEIQPAGSLVRLTRGTFDMRVVWRRLYL